MQVFEIGAKSSTHLTIVTESINDYWFLTFIPADTRPQLATASIITPWIVALLGTLITLIIINWLQKREIDHNQLILLNYVRQLFRKGDNSWPKFNIKVFHDLGKAMEHLANSKGLISNTDETATAEIKRERQRIELVQPSHTALVKSQRVRVKKVKPSLKLWLKKSKTS